MKPMFIFLMMAMLALAVSASMIGNSVSLVLGTAATEYTMNPNYTTVTQNGTDGQCTIQSNATTDKQTVLISYVCPYLAGCTVKTMILSSDALTRYRVKLWSPANISATIATIYNAAGIPAFLSSYQPMFIPFGNRLEIYGDGYLTNTNASAIFEVN